MTALDVRAGPRTGRAGVRPVVLGERPWAALRPHIDATAWERLTAAQERSRAALAGRRVWAFNSTAAGGGVAEMLRTLWPYWRGGGVDARWWVLEAPPAFFRLTKRLHNLVYGVDVRRPTARDRELFARVSAVAGAEAAELVRPGDVVVLEDPQVVGLAGPLKRAGAIVVWRCHIGSDRLAEPALAAWDLLLPHIAWADALVFSRAAYVPPAVGHMRVRCVLPAIDPCSARNQPLAQPDARAVLGHCGLARAAEPPARAAALGVHRRARVLREGPAPRLGAEPLVAALGRWDRLKDPVGIVEAFARHVHDPRARLMVAGPQVGAIVDDPEAGAVFAQVRAAWRGLAPEQRRRIELATLPMADLDENGLIVNALQRCAAVIVKKSLAEGFGLGVAEGLWKARPVVASGVGGHREQIVHGRTGLLVDDPRDLEAFGAAVDELIANPERAQALGRAGREHARARLLGDRHFVEWMGMVGELAA